MSLASAYFYDYIKFIIEAYDLYLSEKEKGNNVENDQFTETKVLGFAEVDKKCEDCIFELVN